MITDNTEIKNDIGKYLQTHSKFRKYKSKRDANR